MASGTIADPADGPLLDFIPAINAGFERPVHLAPLIDVLERIEAGHAVHALVSVPPRHAKTETLLHFAVRALKRKPRRRVLYTSYSGQFANNKSRQAREYARRAGIKLRDDSTSVAEWLTPEFGGFFARGLGGGITGLGFDVALVDDPFKNREEAESQVVRDQRYAGFTSDVVTRIEPGGSILVVHTRWHPDDLIGRLEQEKLGDGSPGWESVNLQALTEMNDGSEQSLWPDRWPVAALHELRDRVGPYDWSSMYQGRPRPKGGAVFNQASTYEALPTSGVRYAIGIDVAYSAKTSSDYSVALVLARHGDIYYVVDVIRMQDKTPVFGRMVKALRAEYGGAPVVWYGSGTERGVADQLSETLGGVPIDFRAAVRDKFTRCQPCASHWNAGKVLLPKKPTFDLDSFVLEIGRFTGLNDAHDDQVDALAAAFDALTGDKPTSTIIGERGFSGAWQDARGF